MSLYYHGTTRESARQIARSGFSPRRPSRAVWFTTSWDYAFGRARHKASRSKDRPIVMECDIDIQRIRERLGRRVTCKGGIVAIRGHVPPTVIRSYSTAKNSKENMGIPLPGGSRYLIRWVSQQLAEWMNEVLGLKPYKGVKSSHPGIHELAQWVIEHYDADATRVPAGELLHIASRWLPEFFEGVKIDPDTLRVHRRNQRVRLEPDPPEEIDSREEEAFDCLAASTPKQRIRGLKLLAALEDPDLFDWCAMYFDDPSADVVVAALRTSLTCDEGDSEVIEPLAEAEDKRVRAAAITALTRHAGEKTTYWFERGLKDFEPCVRLETAALLSQLNPAEHRALFELARYDPNTEVKRIARNLTVGKGFHEIQR